MSFLLMISKRSMSVKPNFIILFIFLRACGCRPTIARMGEFLFLDSRAQRGGAPCPAGGPCEGRVFRLLRVCRARSASPRRVVLNRPA